MFLTTDNDELNLPILYTIQILLVPPESLVGDLLFKLVVPPESLVGDLLFKLVVDLTKSYNKHDPAGCRQHCKEQPNLWKGGGGQICSVTSIV